MELVSTVVNHERLLYLLETN